MVERYIHEISWTSLWRVLLFVILVTIMFLGRHVLLAAFLAIVISSGLEFLVNFLERRGLPRTLGVILIFLTTAVIVIMTVYTIIPLVIVDLNNAFVKIAKLDSPVWGSLVSLKTTQSLSEFINRLSSQFVSGGSPLGAFAGLVGNFALGISVLISAFYLSLTRDGVERFILAIVPGDSEADALRIYERSTRKIGFWFRSQLLLSFIVGSMVLVAMLILKVRFAFLLAILTALLELVPFIGPIIAGSAAVLAAFVTSPDSFGLMLSTLITFVIIQQLESNVLVPLLVGRNVGLHPVIVIIALLLGWESGGFLGVVISVPAAVVLQEAFENWSDTKKTSRTVIK